MIHNEPPQIERMHASCVSIGSCGVLLFGKSGSGKSDVALRLMARGAMLVADDQVILSAEDHTLIASVDDKIRGLLEIRGVGLVRYPVANNIPVRLAVNLVPLEDIEHIPTPQNFEKMGIAIPQISIYGFDSSTPEKIYAALHAMRKNNLFAGFLPDKKEE
ncbi:MAG: HPr kinase/phosphatase C-terminal domain-containing protein [Alphaproteobacteria bacterium]|nr:HPr kinase/phosphatase C-terminal domain-containing protein [Alphaproteobacteria bacterium]